MSDTGLDVLPCEHLQLRRLEVVVLILELNLLSVEETLDEVDVDVHVAKLEVRMV